jgi:hypothetical protein
MLLWMVSVASMQRTAIAHFDSRQITSDVRNIGVLALAPTDCSFFAIAPFQHGYSSAWQQSA